MNLWIIVNFWHDFLSCDESLKESWNVSLYLTRLKIPINQTPVETPDIKAVEDVENDMRRQPCLDKRFNALGNFSHSSLVEWSQTMIKSLSIESKISGLSRISCTANESLEPTILTTRNN